MKVTPTELETLATRLERKHSPSMDATAAKLLREAAAESRKLRKVFDDLLINEIKAYGGIPVYQGRCGREQLALRDVIAEILDHDGR